MRRYIKQIDRNNFIYPNNTVSKYDNEIVHEINDNYPTGTINGISGITLNSTGLTFDVNWSYTRNGSELFRNIGGEYTYVSFHLLGPNQIYYKPWRLIGTISTTGSTITGDTQVTTFDVIPSDLGLTGFTNGDYSLEVRFIGKRSIYPVCGSFTGMMPTPTPTPTATPTPTPTLTATPTPTPTLTATPTPTPSATLNQVIFENVDSDIILSSISVNSINITGADYSILSGQTTTGYTSQVGGSYDIIVNVLSGTSGQRIRVIDSNLVETCINYTGGVGHTFTNQQITIGIPVNIIIENTTCS